MTFAGYSFGQYWEGDTTGVPAHLINDNTNTPSANDNLNIQISLNPPSTNNGTQNSNDTTTVINVSDTTLALTNEIIVEFDLVNVDSCKFIHLEVVNLSVTDQHPCFSKKVPVQALISKGLCVGGHVSIGLNKCLGPGNYRIFITVEDDNKMLSATSSQTITI